MIFQLALQKSRWPPVATGNVNHQKKLKLHDSSKLFYLVLLGVDRSVQVEALLPGGHQQPFPHDLLRGVVRQLQVVDAGVDRRVGAISGVDLPDDRQPREEVGKTTWN